MPKVHKDQKVTFEQEFFQKFHKDTEIKYPLPKAIDDDEKVKHLEKDMRDGTSCVAFKACGTNLPLRFPIAEGESRPAQALADFDRERGKVHLRSRMVLNGVCCQVVVALNLDSFDGFAHLEFDEELAKKEAKMAHDVVDIMPRQRAPAFPPQSQPAATGAPTMWDEAQNLGGDPKPGHAF